MTAPGGIVTVVLRCEQPGCGEYTTFRAGAEDFDPSPFHDHAQDLSSAFWQQARCRACGGASWEGGLLGSLPERRSYRARTHGISTH